MGLFDADYRSDTVYGTPGWDFMTLHQPIWTLTIENVYQVLGSSAQGILGPEAASRLQQYGYNELPEAPRRSLILRFTDQSRVSQSQDCSRAYSQKTQDI